MCQKKEKGPAASIGIALLFFDLNFLRKPYSISNEQTIDSS